MKLFTCDDHNTHYPVGAASIVIAEDETTARQLLDEQLISNGLKPYAESPYELKEVNLTAPIAIVLCDGDY